MPRAFAIRHHDTGAGGTCIDKAVNGDTAGDAARVELAPVIAMNLQRVAVAARRGHRAVAAWRLDLGRAVRAAAVIDGGRIIGDTEHGADPAQANSGAQPNGRQPDHQKGNAFCDLGDQLAPPAANGSTSWSAHNSSALDASVSRSISDFRNAVSSLLQQFE